MRVPALEENERMRDGDKPNRDASLIVMGNSRAGDTPNLAVLWWLAVAAALALVLVIAPIGYLGGGFDDWYYVNAARCWREHGPCLPHNHWEARWPVVVPLALITSVLGESRISVSLWPLAAGISCLLLVTLIGNRLLKPPVGWIAAILLLATPAFSAQLLTPGVGLLELACVLLGAWALHRWHSSTAGRWALITGVALAAAMQVRETSVIPAAAAALWILLHRKTLGTRGLIIAATGFAVPFLIEFAVFAAWTGNPLYRRELSLLKLGSANLLGPIGGDPPFFNKAYIANWRMVPGLHVHWTVDGLLNLMVNPTAGIALSFVPLLLVLGRNMIPAQARQAAFKLWLFAIAIALALIFVLAIDPQPRSMLVPIVASALALALLAWRMIAAQRPAVALAACISAIILGLGLMALHPRADVTEKAAVRWIAEHPNQIETDETTRRMLALVKPSASLTDLGTSKPYLVMRTAVDCRQWVARSGLPLDSLALVDHVPMSRMDRLAPGLGGALCLFQYRRPLAAADITKAQDHFDAQDKRQGALAKVVGN